MLVLEGLVCLHRTVLRRPTRPFRTNTQKRCPFNYRGLSAKVGNQETPGVTGKFGLGIRNEAGQRLIEFCQENTLQRWRSSIQLTKQDQELTVAQIMSSLFPNSHLN